MDSKHGAIKVTFHKQDEKRSDYRKSSVSTMFYCRGMCLWNAAIIGQDLIILKVNLGQLKVSDLMILINKELPVI